MYSDYIKKSKYPANLWTSNFDYLWASSQSRRKKILWKVVDDMLVTFAHTKMNTLYLMCLPFGEGDLDKVVDVLYKCMKYCYEWNNQKGYKTIVRVINSNQYEFLSSSERFNEYFKLKKLKGIERHYGIQNLISLRGKKFKSIRNKVNGFHRKYPNAIIRRYQPSDYNALIQLNKKWLSTSGEKYPKIFDTVYYREIIKHCEELNHLILVVELDGEIVGMTSGGELPSGQSWACLGKTMKNVEGASEVLLIELAREINKINPNIELLNDGSDLGQKGLKLFKEKFRPVLNFKRYRITFVL